MTTANTMTYNNPANTSDVFPNIRFCTTIIGCVNGIAKSNAWNNAGSEEKLENIVTNIGIIARALMGLGRSAPSCSSSRTLPRAYRVRAHT